MRLQTCHIRTFVSLLCLPVLLAIHPLCDEVVCNGMFGGEPEDGGDVSSGQGLGLQGRRDLLQTEPASVLQLCTVQVHLDDRTEINQG